MKRWFVLLILCCMMFSITACEDPVSANEDNDVTEFEENESMDEAEKVEEEEVIPITWEVSEDQVLTISGTGAMCTVEGWETDAITQLTKTPWINETFNKVVINDGITSIDNAAFYAKSAIESVNIPNSVTTIGARAFYQCNKIKEVTLPDALTSIGTLAFYQCRSLEKITIPKSVTSIGERAFNDTLGLIDVVLYVYADSAGEAYAKEFGHEYVIIEQ